MSKEKIISTSAIIYSIIGFIFGVLYMLFYHWPIQAFMSLQFYSVVFTWPLQTWGFLNDILVYGLAGKQI